MKIKSAFVATLFFGLILCIVYYMHIAYIRVNVVFYAAIADAFLASVIAGIALFSLKGFRGLGPFEKSQLLIIWLLAGYGFAISVPTVIDRSLSFYILEKLQQRGGEIKLESIEDVFTKEYVKEHRLMDVRLTEQLESGTILIEGGCVKLTNKGSVIASIGRFYRQNLLPKKRLLMGKYTDDLTDPFRYSKKALNYECK
jgi:hypothetical protein